MTETKPKDYWISPTALKISLNALSDPDYMQASAASGAMIMCYMKGINGLEFDHGHNYKRWPLKISPTYFTTPTRKYVYVKIPRPTVDPADVDTDVAQVVFPSEHIDLYGMTDGGEQLGDVAYYYIYLQGIISGGEPTSDGLRRHWEQEINTGTLNSDEATEEGGTGEWWKYDPITDTVTFLKTIAYAVFDYLKAAQAEIHNLNVTGTFDAIKGYIDDIRSHNYQSGMLDGSGFRLTSDNGEGASELEVDLLKVRKKATFMELEVREETFVGGNQHYSPAGSIIYRVEYMDMDDQVLGYSVMKVPFLLKKFAFLGRMFNYAARKRIRLKLSDEEWRQVHHFRCYLIADDGTTATRNWWKVGDQPRCQTFNKAVSAQNKRDNGYNWKQDHFNDDPSSPMPKYTTIEGPFETSYYWRLVTNVGSEKLEDERAYDFVDMPYEGWDVTIGGVRHYYTDDEKRSFRDAGSGIPVAGDTIVCMGNRTDQERMNMISLYTSGNDNNPPAIKGYRGIHTFNIKPENKVFEISPNEFLIRSRMFKLLDDSGYEFPVPLERGEWQQGVRYHWYDRVSWQGCIWLCQVVDDYMWEDAAGNNYEEYRVTDIDYNEGEFEYATGKTDHYYRTGRVNGVTVYYIKYYTTSEPDKNNDLWLREVNKGRNGIDGDGVEYVYIRTATNQAPYITTSSDTYQDKTYLDDDYLPLSSEGRTTDDPVGITKQLPYEWVIKRTKADPDPETGERIWHKYGEGPSEGRMSLWATYSENAVRLDISNEMDMVLTSESGKVDAARTVETVVHLYDGTSEVNISAAELAVSGAPASTIATVIQASEGTGKNGRKLSLAFIKDAVMADVYEITVSYTYKDVPYNAVFTVTASKGQAVWQLAPGMSSIPFQRDANNALTPASRDVSLMLVKVDKGSTETYATLQTDLTVRYAFDAMPASATAGTGWTSGNITVANSAENLFIALFNAAGTLLDRETVPVIKDGVNGQNVVRLDLDNENDTMLYNGSGTLVSGNVTTTGALFDGMTDVSSQATFSIDSQTGCTASISGRTVTVSAMSATAGNVIVKAVYKERSYKATLTLKKIVDGDKYELVITPNSVAYNATTDTPATSTLSVQVWKTSVNSSGGSTRALSEPPSGYAVYANGTVLTASSTGTYSYTTDNSAISEVLVKIATDVSSSDILDSETVPIAKASNGAKGDTGSQGAQGRYQEIQYAISAYKTTTSSTVMPYDCSESEWSSTAPMPSVYYPYVWRRTRTYDPATGSYTSWIYVRETGENGKDGKDGKDGQDGDPGKTGLWYRYAGVWNVDVTSVTNTNTVGYYVKYGSTFYLNKKASGSANTSTPSSSSSSWEVMTSVFEYFITKATFADTAYLGSFIINGDWMISQNGSQGSYSSFDPTGFKNYVTSGASYSGFIPNFAIDGKTGTTYQNKAYVEGTIKASRGKIGKFDISEYGYLFGTDGSISLSGDNVYMNCYGTLFGKFLELDVSSQWNNSDKCSIIYCPNSSFTLPGSIDAPAGSIIFFKSSTDCTVYPPSGMKILDDEGNQKDSVYVGKNSNIFIRVSYDRWAQFFCA